MIERRMHQGGYVSARFSQIVGGALRMLLSHLNRHVMLRGIAVDPDHLNRT